MAQGFNTELSSQQEWGWLLAIWLFLSSTAAALFLASMLFALPFSFALLAFGLLLLGGVVLLVEQGSPRRAWRAVFRPGTSWLSRGVLFVSLFMLTSLLYLAPALGAWVPWQTHGLAARALGVVAALCALMIVLYPGFFLAKNRSIPFWNTALLPLTFITYAALSAAAMLLLGSAFLAGAPGLPRYALPALLVANGLLVGAYLVLMWRAGGPACESVLRLSRPPVRWFFHAGVILGGMLLPLLLLLFVPAAAALAGACLLLGSLLYRYCVLKVGVYVPPALVQEGVDFSRMNRNNEELRREYANAMGGPAGNRS